MRGDETEQGWDSTFQPDDGADELDADGSRLSRHEVRLRMLRAAAARVSDSGIIAGLDYLVLEQLIEDAGVSRTSVHRIWGGKENFLADVILYLINPDESVGAAFDQSTLDLARTVIESNRDRLITPEGRIEVLREAIRVAVLENFSSIQASVHWRSHIALSCTGTSMPPEQQQRIQSALREVERRFIARMADFYELMLAYFQRTPRPGMTLKQVAAAGAAVVEGLVIKSALIPETVNPTIKMPALNDNEAEWHLAAVGFLGVIEAMTSPVTPDERERLILP